MNTTLNNRPLADHILTIIIADDHPSVRYGIRSILEDESFVDVILEAENGQQVIELLQKRSIDIVFMDIAMTGGDGFAATETICKLFPNTKVIAISMYREERYVREMFAKGAKGYLLKNADREIIIQAMKEVFHGGIYISKEIAHCISSDSGTAKTSTRKNNHAERLREIIYLMCFEKTSKEIAGILFLSPRTIEEYRRQINEVIGSVSVVGVINYANEQGIREDILLEKKFDNHLKKPKKKFD